MYEHMSGKATSKSKAPMYEHMTGKATSKSKAPMYEHMTGKATSKSKAPMYENYDAITQYDWVENMTNVQEGFTDVNKLYSINDGYELQVPISKSTCSTKCCGYYWNEKDSNMFKKNDPVKWEDIGVGKKYRTSNTVCMGDGVTPSGCRCHTVDQYELLARRGGNGSKDY